MGAPSPCMQPGCTARVQGGWCAEHRPKRKRDTRPSAAARGYDRRWRATAAAYLAAHPLCECEDCIELPDRHRDTAVMVDHIDGLGPLGPRGYDPDNLRSMSHAHHSKRTARDQPGGWNR
jgi:5-methylcytosine-specific restriction protein A